MNTLFTCWFVSSLLWFVFHRSSCPAVLVDFVFPLISAKKLSVSHKIIVTHLSSSRIGHRRIIITCRLSVWASFCGVTGAGIIPSRTLRSFFLWTSRHLRTAFNRRFFPFRLLFRYGFIYFSFFSHILHLPFFSLPLIFISSLCQPPNRSIRFPSFRNLFQGNLRRSSGLFPGHKVPP